MLVVAGAIMLLNFQIYYRSKKMEKIIAEKPKLFNSNAASVVFSVTFFLFSLLMIVTAPFYSKYLLERFCS